MKRRRTQGAHLIDIDALRTAIRDEMTHRCITLERVSREMQVGYSALRNVINSIETPLGISMNIYILACAWLGHSLYQYITFDGIDANHFNKHKTLKNEN